MIVEQELDYLSLLLELEAARDRATGTDRGAREAINITVKAEELTDDIQVSMD